MGWHWLMKLHRFQVCSSVIHPLCIALSSPPQVPSPSSTVSPPPSPPSPPPPLWSPPHCCPCLWGGCGFVCVLLERVLYRVKEASRRSENTTWFHLQVEPNEPNKNRGRLRETENRVVRREGAGGLGEKVRGLSKKQSKAKHSSMRLDPRVRLCVNQISMEEELRTDIRSQLKGTWNFHSLFAVNALK